MATQKWRINRKTGQPEIHGYLRLASFINSPPQDLNYIEDINFYLFLEKEQALNYDPWWNNFDLAAEGRTIQIWVSNTIRFPVERAMKKELKSSNEDYEASNEESDDTMIIDELSDPKEWNRKAQDDDEVEDSQNESDYE